MSCSLKQPPKQGTNARRSSSKHTGLRPLQLQLIMHVLLVVHVLLSTKAVHADLVCMGSVKIGNINNIAIVEWQHSCSIHAYHQKDA
jgi:hypothetical protein